MSPVERVVVCSYEKFHPGVAGNVLPSEMCSPGAHFLVNVLPRGAHLLENLLPHSEICSPPQASTWRRTQLMKYGLRAFSFLYTIQRATIPAYIICHLGSWDLRLRFSLKSDVLGSRFWTRSTQVIDSRSECRFAVIFIAVSRGVTKPQRQWQ